MYIIFVLYAIRTQIWFNKKSQISWTPAKKNYEYLKSCLICQYQTWFFIQSENGTHKLLAKAMSSVTSWLEISWAVKFLQDPKILTKYNGIWLQWTIYHIYQKRKTAYIFILKIETFETYLPELWLTFMMCIPNTSLPLPPTTQFVGK